MRKSATILASVALISSLSVTAPAPAQARGGFFPGIAGGLISGAIFSGIASNAHAYSGLYYGPYPYVHHARPYYDGYSPYYAGYGYAPRYYRPFGYPIY